MSGLDGSWRSPVVGVLGGMGPGATVSFLETVLRLTEAGRDQDHLDMLVLNHATMPDRTAYLLDPSLPDPGPVLAADLQRLADWGAEFAVILCNTAHAFLPAPLPLPLIHLVEVGAQEAVRTARALRGEGVGRTGPTPGAEQVAETDREHAHRPVVAVMATTGTVTSGLYQDALRRFGAEPRVPDAALQGRVMGVIYGRVKAGLPVAREEFEALVQECGQGAGAVLLGCTELSLLQEQLHLADPRVVDAQEVLAREAILRAGARLRTGA